MDPFAGGGAIPLEAQRLGLEAHASDLNPVAVLINKALIEIPPEWAGRSPVFPGASAGAHSWPRATGLAEDVRRYGHWMGEEAEKRIGHLYPKAKFHDGTEATVIAWLWARTVTCPNPACAGTMPLVRSFWLAKKKGSERYVHPIPDGKRVRFEIRGPQGVAREGTVNRTGATCLLCETPVPLAYIRAEGKAGRMSTQLMALAAHGPGQRYYLPPDEDQLKAADVPRPDDVPDSEIPYNPRYLTAPNYGMSAWADLFTNRQLATLTTLSDLVHKARARVQADGGERAYADAVATYLALCASKAAAFHTSQARWRPNESKTAPAFGRQALPMVWDFAETNVFAGAGGDWLGIVDGSCKALEGLPAFPSGYVSQGNATAGISRNALIATDPPYYDNVGYSDLADYFYVWLRRSLRDVFPELTGTLLTPKAEELVADPFRHGGKDEAESFFQQGFEKVFQGIRQGASEDYPITVFYAFKQAETDDEGQHASTGWETLLEGMLKAGWAVTATWPMRTEGVGRMRNQASNALASSIVLACRPRSDNAPVTDKRGLIAALRNEMPDALRKLLQGSVAPVDLPQAAIGPGMAMFSRHARVNEPGGEAMRVRTALDLINQVLGEVQSELEGDFGTDTRWCLEWFKTFGFDEGPFGDAETLSKAKNTSVAGLERAGVLRSRGGRVRLLSILDIPNDYDPGSDDRVSEWKIVLHLAKRLAEQGGEAAARLMIAARAVVDLDAVRELAYLLFSIAEKHGWTETARLFNGLGTSWSDLAEDARKPGLAGAHVQIQLDFEAE